MTQHAHILSRCTRTSIRKDTVPSLWPTAWSQRKRTTASDEQNMTLLGFLTFADPPKPDAAQVLQALKNDGVQVKILTGDNELVTRHVCEQVGLDASRIVLGSELDHMTD